MEELTMIIQTLQNKLEDKKEIVFAYLFGSKVEGRSNKLSDIDIAIYVNRKKVIESSIYGYKSEMIVELEEVLNSKVDLVILNETSLFLAYYIIKDGKIIINRSDKERAAFHFRVVRDYLDFKPFIDIQNYYLKERLLKGSFGGG